MGLNVGYAMTNAGSGLQIGMPPFSPARFPEVEEDVELISGTISFSLQGNADRAFAADYLALSYGSVIDGRNTARSDLISLSLGFRFDTY